MKEKSNKIKKQKKKAKAYKKLKNKEKSGWSTVGIEPGAM